MPEDPFADRVPARDSMEAYRVWRRWQVEQFARLKTLDCRRKLVELFDDNMTGEEREVPERVATGLDDLVTLDAMLPPDDLPEMHPDYADHHFHELLHELDRRRILGESRRRRRRSE